MRESSTKKMRVMDAQLPAVAVVRVPERRVQILGGAAAGGYLLYLYMSSKGERGYEKARGDDPLYGESVESLRRIANDKKDPRSARAKKILKQKSKKRDPQTGKKK